MHIWMMGGSFLSTIPVSYSVVFYAYKVSISLLESERRLAVSRHTAVVWRKWYRASLCLVEHWVMKRG